MSGDDYSSDMLNDEMRCSVLLVTGERGKASWVNGCNFCFIYSYTQIVGRSGRRVNVKGKRCSCAPCDSGVAVT